MRKYAKIAGSVLIILLILGFLALRFLEPYTTTRNIRPSQEVQNDQFYVLEQWLLKSGHLVQRLQQIDAYELMDRQENTVILASDAFLWTEEGTALLLNMVESGLSLFIYTNSWKQELYEPLYLDLLLETGLFSWTEDSDADAEDKGGTEEGDVEKEDGLWFTSSLKINRKSEQTIIYEDDNGTLLAVGKKHGKGQIFFGNGSFFMQNSGLVCPDYADAAWKLSGRQDTDKSGILIIWNNTLPPAFFGRILSRGNSLPLVISSILLLIIALWMSLSHFGVYPYLEEVSGKPIQERFLSEALFLKKYKALDSYISSYQKLIRSIIRKKTSKDPGEDKELASHVAAYCHMDEAYIQPVFIKKGRLRSKDFLKHIHILESIIERLE